MRGETSIQPMLAVRGGKRAIAFYEEAFDATVVHQVEDPDGNVVARLAIGAAEFWVHDSDDGSAPSMAGPVPFRIVLVVPDVDRTYRQTLIAGAKGLSEPCEAHGWRTGRLIDPFGHQWEISKPLDDCA